MIKLISSETLCEARRKFFITQPTQYLLSQCNSSFSLWFFGYLYGNSSWRFIQRFVSNCMKFEIQNTEPQIIYWLKKKLILALSDGVEWIL